MGECVSLCENKKQEENKDDNYDSEDKSSNNGLVESMKRTKKNKTRIPKNIIVKDDEEEDIAPIQEKINNQKNNINDGLNNDKLIDNEYIYDKDKIEKARNNWNYLIDKLIAKRIDILREIIKKEKEEDSDEENEEEEQKEKNKGGNDLKKEKIEEKKINYNKQKCRFIF